MATTTDRGDTSTAAGVAGVVAAAVGLATGELVSSLLPGAPSLVGAVGDTFIDGPGVYVAKPAIALFGTNDKLALVVGTVAVCLVLGWFVGRAALRRPWIGPAAFAAAGAAGALCAEVDPIDEVAWAAVGAAVGALAGASTLWFLLRQLAPTPGTAPSGLTPATGAGVGATAATIGATTATAADVGVDQPGAPRMVDPSGEGQPGTPLIVDPAGGGADRRAFMGWAAAAGGFAAVAAVASRSLRGPTAAEQARADVVLTSPTRGIDAAATRAASLDVPGISPYVTPNADFYRIDTALVTPQVDPSSWSLSVTGLVDSPLTLTFDELLAEEMVEQAVTLSCVSNEVGGKLVGNAVWQGVPLRRLLERAGTRPDAQQVVGVSVDGFTAGFPVGAALDGRVALVAVGMNGEPLPIDHGFPARLVVSGLYGYVSATKWLQEIRLTRWDGVDGYWIPRGWSKEAPVKTQSRIDVPGRGVDLVPGPTPIAGVAWAPGRGIAKVEVQVDDGEWVEARLGDVVADDTWRQWVVTWDATPGRHTLRVRATDGDGVTQTADERPPAPDGATGHHERTVEVAEP